MSRLTSVELTDVKQVTGKFPLQPVTIITAPGWRGKTAITDAVQILQVGYLPRLGKKPGATMSLAGSDRMEIVGNWDTGSATRLEWAQTGDSVSRKVTGQRFGDPTGVDFLTFMAGGSAEERASMIFARCGLDPQTFDFDAVRSVFDAVATPDSEKARAVRNEFVLAFGNAKRMCMAGESTVPKFIDAVIAWLKEQGRGLDAEVKRATASLQEMANLDALPSTAGETVKEALERRNLAGRALADLLAVQDAGTAALARVNTLKIALQTAREHQPDDMLAGLLSATVARIETLKASRGVKVDAARLTELKARMDGLQRQMESNSRKIKEQHRALQGTVREAAPADWPKDWSVGTFQTRVDAAQTVLDADLAASGWPSAGDFIAHGDDAARGRESTIRHRQSLHDSEAHAVADRKRDLESKVENRNAKSDAISDIDAKPCCPTCGAAGEHWKPAKMAALREEIETLNSKIKDLMALIATGEESVARQTTEINGLKVEDERRTELFRKTRRSIDVLAAATAGLDKANGLVADGERVTTRCAEITASIEGFEAIERALKAQIDPIVAEIAAAEAAYVADEDVAIELGDEERERDRYNKATEDRRAQVAKLEEAEAAFAATPKASAEHIQAARQAGTDADRLVTEAMARQRTKDEATLRESQTATLNTRIAEHLALGDWLDKMVNEGTTAKATLITKSIGPIMQATARFTRGILAFDLEFRDGDFGYQSGTRFATTATFSGGEMRVVHAALQYALTLGADNRIVIIDELTTMEPDVAGKVVNRMAEMVDAGEIHQFIGVALQTGLAAMAPYLSGQVAMLKV